MICLAVEIIGVPSPLFKKVPRLYSYPPPSFGWLLEFFKIVNTSPIFFADRQTFFRVLLAEFWKINDVLGLM